MFLPTWTIQYVKRRPNGARGMLVVIVAILI
jgi:hypothetical protein